MPLDQPWELALSIGFLVAAIRGVAVIAARMYAAGVLLYGQRPGLRAFIGAARPDRRARCTRTGRETLQATKRQLNSN